MCAGLSGLSGWKGQKNSPDAIYLIQSPFSLLTVPFSTKHPHHSNHKSHPATQRPNQHSRATNTSDTFQTISSSKVRGMTCWGSLTRVPCSTPYCYDVIGRRSLGGQLHGELVCHCLLGVRQTLWHVRRPDETTQESQLSEVFPRTWPPCCTVHNVTHVWLTEWRVTFLDVHFISRVCFTHIFWLLLLGFGSISRLSVESKYGGDGEDICCINPNIKKVEGLWLNAKLTIYTCALANSLRMT